MNEETFGGQKSCQFDQYVASQTIDQEPESMKKVISIKVEVNDKKTGFISKIKDTSQLD